MEFSTTSRGINSYKKQLHRLLASTRVVSGITIGISRSNTLPGFGLSLAKNFCAAPLRGLLNYPTYKYLMNIAIDQDYIRVIDGFLSAELSQRITELFERDRSRQVEIGDRYIELDCFDQSSRKANPLHRPIIAQWREIGDQVVDRALAAVRDYRLRWDPLTMLPNDFALEGLRTKVYRQGTHEFRLHVDQANRASSSRFLAILIYLNDSDAGTEFPQLGLTVAAQQGRALIFPPNWQYPHRGLCPQTGDKYIMSTYLHYKD